MPAAEPARTHTRPNPSTAIPHVSHQKALPSDGNVVYQPVNQGGVAPGIIRAVQQLYHHQQGYLLVSTAFFACGTRSHIHQFQTDEQAAQVWEASDVSQKEFVLGLYATSTRAASLQRQASDDSFSKLPTRYVWQANEQPPSQPIASSSLIRHPTLGSAEHHEDPRPSIGSFSSYGSSESSFTAALPVSNMQDVTNLGSSEEPRPPVCSLQLTSTEYSNSPGRIGRERHSAEHGSARLHPVCVVYA